MITAFWTIATWTGAIWWGCIALMVLISILAFIHHLYGGAGILWFLVIIAMGVVGYFE